MQWKGLTLEEPPSWSRLTSTPGKYEEYTHHFWPIPQVCDQGTRSKILSSSMTQLVTLKSWLQVHDQNCRTLLKERPLCQVRWTKMLPAIETSSVWHWRRKIFACSTKYSQAVTHPSTNLARCCLTLVIGRELVCSAWYGRRHFACSGGALIYSIITIDKNKKKAYGTKYSQAVTHPSTNLARCCLTLVIERELVCSAWYGRRHFRCSGGGIKKRHFQIGLKVFKLLTA